MSKKFIIGFVLSLVSAVAWGTSFIASRYLMRGHAIDPASLSLIRFIIAGLFLLSVGLLTHQRMFDFDLKTLGLMIIQGSIGMAGQSFFIFWGQQSSCALNSSMIMSTTPIMIMLAGLLWGRKIHFYQIIGMIIATVGCLMVIKTLDGGGLHLDSFSRGDLWLFIAAWCWTIYVLCGARTLKRVGGFVYTTYVMLGATPVLFVVSFFTETHLPVEPLPWLVVLYLALIPTAVAFWAWNASQKYIDLSLLNIMQYLTPVTTLILSYPFLGEKSDTWQCLGVFLVILGVSLDPEILHAKTKSAISTNRE